MILLRHFVDIYFCLNLSPFSLLQSSSHLGRMASTHRARKRIREAKRKARPELATREMWVQNDYANTFDLSWERVILLGLV